MSSAFTKLAEIEAKEDGQVKFDDVDEKHPCTGKTVPGGAEAARKVKFSNTTKHPCTGKTVPGKREVVSKVKFSNTTMNPCTGKTVPGKSEIAKKVNFDADQADEANPCTGKTVPGTSETANSLAHKTGLKMVAEQAVKVPSSIPIVAEQAVEAPSNIPVDIPRCPASNLPSASFGHIYISVNQHNYLARVKPCRVSRPVESK